MPITSIQHICRVTLMTINLNGRAILIDELIRIFVVSPMSSRERQKTGFLSKLSPVNISFAQRIAKLSQFQNESKGYA